MLPLTILGCVTVVLTLFVVGYLTLSTPDTPTEDTNTVIGKAVADPNEETSNDEAVEDGETEQPTQLSDGQFDFDRHRYYSFPLPFVSNLASGKGMLTVEIAIATYGNTPLPVKPLSKKWNHSTRKIRSAINLRLAQQKLADIDSVEKRKKLTARLLDDIKLIVDKPDTEQPSAITDVHFVKFVISEA